MHDAHVHIHQKELIELMQKENIPCIANVQNQEQFDFITSFDNIHYSVGLHPWDAETMNLEDLLPLMQKADFIGEIGMDNVWCETDLTKQREIFNAQLDLANQLHKPVFLHTKGMEKEIIECILQYKNTYIVHWYSCMDFLDEYIDYGCWFTLGPSICFDEAVRQVATKVDLDHLLIESDGLSAIEWCEDHTIELKDYPSYLKRTIHELANIRNIDASELEKILDQNFNNLVKRG